MTSSYSLADNTWDDKEIQAINRVIASDRYTMGSEVAAYEHAFARKVGSTYAVMSNSGSSANLLMIAALCYSGKLAKGNEVIVPAVSWSTTYTPLHQFGLKLRFVDIDVSTMNLDPTLAELAITQDTKMIFAVNLLGNANDYDVLNRICRDHNLLLVEDNCEAYGGTYNHQQLGTIGLMGSYSTFFSHHLCTMEGGMTVTDDEDLYHYMLSIRAHGWTRNLPESTSFYKKHSDPFYENFNFIMPGFNLRPLEMEGAVGSEQLLKSDAIIEQRRKNARYFIQHIKALDGVRWQQEVGCSSWFGFAMVLDGMHKGKRQLLIKAFADNHIDVRPIVAGNYTRHKVIQYMDYSIYDTLENADLIHDHGFFVGNHSRDIRSEIDHLIQVMKQVLNYE